HRADGRKRPRLAGPHSRGHGGGRAECGAHLARSPTLCHRISRQNPAILGETIVKRMRVVSLPAAIRGTSVGIPASAGAATVERVVSAGGIEAWLVHERAVPLIAVEFAFVGGAVQDPPGKAGTATLTASLLDAGAGELDSTAFSGRLERKAIHMG